MLLLLRCRRRRRRSRLWGGGSGRAMLARAGIGAGACELGGGEGDGVGLLRRAVLRRGVLLLLLRQQPLVHLRELFPLVSQVLVTGVRLALTGKVQESDGQWVQRGGRGACVRAAQGDMRFPLTADNSAPATKTRTVNWMASAAGRVRR